MLNKLKKVYHFCLAWLGSVIYRNPSKDIFVLGVTGTKGKSTVIELINAIMESVGKRTAIISSVRFKIGAESRGNLTGMTMPGRFFIQKFLREAVDKECQYAFIEVTSQGVGQYRDCFINFNAGLLTNLQPEHIEAHGSFENYRSSKIKFFRNSGLYSSKRHKLFFINSAVKDKEMFAEAVAESGKVIFYDKKDLKKMKWKIKLLGNFNLENIAAAVSFARSQNIDWDIIKNTIENFDGVPGRLEFIQKYPFTVIIDYAHTPDSLEKVYETVRAYKEKENGRRLICVLGAAGGGRDVWKRPIMGQIASEYCDEIILTNEDPFDDDPYQIVEQIAAGVESCGRKDSCQIIIDRRAAIKKAVEISENGDVLIITGKGSEPFMHLDKGRRINWNERKIVREILNEKTIKVES